ncbi:hypothetical protein HMPREF9141_1454 [Prevotella multiformis DSM 16608]|uniref:Uncharacterized protein n=1 Tax=Prevotella multiformis DSM 16608 TaxID=888743 RepID=F0F787_9BACT|nr:hypothetical protein HMPREF9141_1454 [Prevotella multiformis DSM 16608]
MSCNFSPADIGKTAGDKPARAVQQTGGGSARSSPVHPDRAQTAKKTRPQRA